MSSKKKDEAREVKKDSGMPDSRAVEGLRASSELFSLFMRHSPVFAYIKSVTSTESRLLYASDNYQRMLGATKLDIEGKTMAELFPPEFAAKITADDWAVVKNGSVLQVEKDMDDRSYISIKFPFVQGGKNMLAGYMFDITERKQSESKLHDSELKLMESVEKLRKGEAKLHEAEEKQREAEDGLREGKARLQEIDGKLREAEGKLQAGERKLQEVNGRLRKDEEALRAGESKLREAEGKLQEIDGRQRKGEEALRAGESKLREAEGKLQAGERKLQEVNGRLRKDEEALRAGELKLRETEDRLQAAEQKLRMREDRLRELEGTLQTGEQRLRTGEDKQRISEDKLRSGEEALRAGQSRVHEAEDKLRAGEEALRRDREKLREEAEALRRSEEALRADREKVQEEEERLREVEKKLRVGEDKLRRDEERLRSDEEVLRREREKPRAEKAPPSSLDGKEILREAHINARNNMYSIIALMEMQRKMTGKTGGRLLAKKGMTDSAMSELEKRIEAIALLHKCLYQSQEPSRVDLQDYLSALVSQLQTSLDAPPQFACSVEASGVVLKLDTALPVGIIVNELVTNALKYAFPKNGPQFGADRCEIKVSLERRNNEHTLIVDDNGVGLPKIEVLSSKPTLGLRLVRMLGVDQLGGRLTVNRTKGTRFVLKFNVRE